jgi:hypothetical protein
MLLNEIQQENLGLRINLNTGKVAGNKVLLSKLVDADEVDTDELEKNSDGNAEGMLLVWVKDEFFEIEYDQFAKDFLKYDTLNSKKQKALLNDLADTIKRIVKI